MMDSSDFSGFESSLVRACGSYGLLLSAAQVASMWDHFCRVIAANAKFNLTRITEPVRAAVEHYADSLLLLRWLMDRAVAPRRALDVGTGGGWPAVPLAIVLRDVHWTAIDSTGKKARFVAEVVDQLHLANLTALHVRASEWAGQVEPFDLVVSRAAAKLPEFIAGSADLVAPGGHLVAYKSAHLTETEREEGFHAAERARLEPLPDGAIAMMNGDEVIRRLFVAFRRRA